MYVECKERSSKSYLYGIKVITSHFLQPIWFTPTWPWCWQLSHGFDSLIGLVQVIGIENRKTLNQKASNNIFYFFIFLFFFIFFHNMLWDCRFWRNDRPTKLSFNKFLSSNLKNLALHLITFWNLKTQMNTQHKRQHHQPRCCKTLDQKYSKTWEQSTHNLLIFNFVFSQSTLS
jgi:hypothetical protein